MALLRKGGSRARVIAEVFCLYLISGEAAKSEELQLGVYYRFEESSNVVIQGSRG